MMMASKNLAQRTDGRLPTNHILERFRRQNERHPHRGSAWMASFWLNVVDWEFGHAAEEIVHAGAVLRRLSSPTYNMKVTR